MERTFTLLLLLSCISLQLLAMDKDPPKFETQNGFFLNHGQINSINNDEAVKYYTQKGALSVYFLDDRVSYVLRDKMEGQLTSSRIDLVFENANIPTINGLDETQGKTTFYTNECPEGIAPDLYGQVVYKNIYNNIDLVYYFSDKGTLKYDFVIHPGGKAEDIKVAYEGDAELDLVDNKLKVASVVGDIFDARPFTYTKESCDVVETSFSVSEEGRVSFNVGEYDKNETLIIDPEVQWSTFYGGVTFDDAANSTTDAAGNVYVTGQTFSRTFPDVLTQYGNGEQGDIVIGKFDPEGNHQWTILYGGDDESESEGIVSDQVGNVYVVGMTRSLFLPSPPDPETTPPLEGSGNEDIIIIKVTDGGAPIDVALYGAFNGEDVAQGIEIFNDNEIFITGFTGSDESEFPIVGSTFQTVKNADLDGFVMKIDSELDITWSTYIGGNGGDIAYDIAVDSDGNPYVAGSTSSTDLPTSGNAFTPGPVADVTDAFVARLDGDAGTLDWLQYYGGTQIDFAQDIVLYENEIVYVVGETSSSDLEIVNQDTLLTYQSTYGGGVADGFIFRLDAADGEAQWSSYLGGSGDDRLLGVTVTSGAEAIVTGYTESADFPVENTDEALNGSLSGEQDAVLALFSDGGEIRYSGLFGGARVDVGRDLTFDRGEEQLYVIGRTRSQNFPVTDGAYQSTFPGEEGDAQIFIYTLSVSITPSEPVDTTQIDPEDPITEPGDTIPDLFCDAVRNNVIFYNADLNSYFQNSCLNEVATDTVIFFGTTAEIDGGSNFNYLWQIYSDDVEAFINIRNANGNLAIGKNLEVGDLDLADILPGEIRVRRLVIAPGCTDSSNEEIIEPGLFEFAFVDLVVQSNCANQDITLDAIPNASSSDITSYTYTVTYEGDTEVFTEANPNIGSYPAGTVDITIDIETAEGCIGSDAQEVTIFSTPEASFEYENEVVCLDYPYQFTNTATSDPGDPIVSFLWDFGGGMTSQEENPTVTFTESGQKIITLTVTTAQGCTAQATQTFTADEVLESPEVDAGSDRSIDEGTIIQLEPNVTFPEGQELATALWTSDPSGAFVGEETDPNTIFAGAEPREDSYLILTVTSDIGCVGQDSLFVEVDEFGEDDDGDGEEDDEDNIPNLFTPNEDGFNDLFIIPFLEDFPGARVRIYNRWGSLVYDAVNYSENPWDGTYDGEEAPEGVYYWNIEFPGDRNDSEGTITLLR